MSTWHSCSTFSSGLSKLYPTFIWIGFTWDAKCQWCTRENVHLRVNGILIPVLRKWRQQWKTVSLKPPKYFWIVLLSLYLKLLNYLLDKESMSFLLPFLNTPSLGHKPKASPSQGNSLGWNCNTTLLSDFNGIQAFILWRKKSNPLSDFPPQDLASSPHISCNVPAALRGCRESNTCRL